MMGGGREGEGVYVFAARNETDAIIQAQMHWIKLELRS